MVECLFKETTNEATRSIHKTSYGALIARVTRGNETSVAYGGLATIEDAHEFMDSSQETMLKVERMMLFLEGCEKAYKAKDPSLMPDMEEYL